MIFCPPVSPPDWRNPKVEVYLYLFLEKLLNNIKNLPVE